jgi:hypothetical protein
MCRYLSGIGLSDGSVVSSGNHDGHSLLIQYLRESKGIVLDDSHHPMLKRRNTWGKLEFIPIIGDYHSISHSGAVGPDKEYARSLFDLSVYRLYLDEDVVPNNRSIGISGHTNDVMEAVRQAPEEDEIELYHLTTGINKNLLQTWKSKMRIEARYNIIPGQVKFVENQALILDDNSHIQHAKHCRVLCMRGNARIDKAENCLVYHMLDESRIADLHDGNLFPDGNQHTASVGNITGKQASYQPGFNW